MESSIETALHFLARGFWEIGQAGGLASVWPDLAKPGRGQAEAKPRPGRVEAEARSSKQATAARLQASNIPKPSEAEAGPSQAERGRARPS